MTDTVQTELMMAREIVNWAGVFIVATGFTDGYYRLFTSVVLKPPVGWLGRLSASTLSLFPLFHRFSRTWYQVQYALFSTENILSPL